MNLKKNSKFLLLFVAILFVAFASGGDYLHGYIHHHNSRESHQQCGFYLLQIQVLLGLGVFTLIAAGRPAEFQEDSFEIPVFNGARIIFNPRAPPPH